MKQIIQCKFLKNNPRANDMHVQIWISMYRCKKEQKTEKKIQCCKPLCILK